MLLLAILYFFNNFFFSSTSYIEEALVVLAEDKMTPQYQNHLPVVISDLCNQITTFLHQNASNTYTKKMRRLLMLAQSLK